MIIDEKENAILLSLCLLSVVLLFGVFFGNNVSAAPSEQCVQEESQG